MRSRARIIPIIIVVIAVACLGWQWQVSHGGREVSSATSQPRPITNEGERRDEVLRSLTRDYVARGENVSPGMASGNDLAPVEYLNRELDRQGAKWRVRQANGESLQMFDIS